MASQYYKYKAPTRRVDSSDDISRGINIGQEIGKLIGQFGGAIKGAKQDAVANQLMNTQDAPRAALVDPGMSPSTDPDPDPGQEMVQNQIAPSVSTAGTRPITGGVAEMKMRQDFSEDALNRKYKEAQLANVLAETAGTGRYAKRATLNPRGVNATISGAKSRWESGGPAAGNQPGRTGATKAGKPLPYEAGSSDVQNDASSDDPTKIRKDFEAVHGAGTYDKFQQALINNPGMKPDANGNYSVIDEKSGATTSIAADEAPIWLNRANAARRKMGLPHVGPLGQPSNPTSTAPVGSEENPVIGVDKLHVRSIPEGKWVKDPETGEVYQVQKLSQ